MTSRNRNICFTSFENDPPKFVDQMSYLIYGKETCPDTGKEHWQGYTEFRNGLSWKVISELLGSNKIHLEKRVGTSDQAMKYCQKDGEFKTHGQISQPGKRNDLLLVVETLNKTGSIADTAFAHPEQYVKYHKGILAYKHINDKVNAKKWRDLSVVVLWGATGVGKTRAAISYSEDYYKKQAGTKWFDGYDGEDTLIIDEMEEGRIEWTTLLSWLDGHCLQVETKGGHVWANWTRVYITSNTSPEEWYPNRKGHNADPLFRRIGDIRQLGVTLCPHAPYTEVNTEVTGNTKL